MTAGRLESPAATSKRVPQPGQRLIWLTSSSVIERAFRHLGFGQTTSAVIMLLLEDRTPQGHDPVSDRSLHLRVQDDANCSVVSHLPGPLARRMRCFPRNLIRR